MRRGQVIRFTSVTDVLDGGRVKLGYRAPRGDVYVALVLGVEAKDATDETGIDPNRVLEEMGWSYPGGDEAEGDGNAE